MTIYKIEPLGFAANCYLVTSDGKTAVAIDPAQPRVLAEAEKRGLTVTHVILTHGHFDHIAGAAALQARGAKIGCLSAERGTALYGNLGEELGDMKVPPFTVDFTFEDGDTLDLAGISFKVIATAGHTAGSACFLAENALFTGDTLFCRGCGRTDLPTGNFTALAKSLNKLFALDKDYTVYPGHGEDTTLRAEADYYTNL